ncbi:MAG: NAD(P)/FAD-dependent oxidoreductase [Patescibacteria group bacterium]
MTNILILGAGFGGISAALELEKKLGNDRDFKITLIDRNNFHLFTPSLYEVATVYGLIQDSFAQYLRGSVAIPIYEIFSGKRINFVQAEIRDINLKDRFVITNGANRIDFDYLIIALGGETEFYGVPGVREYAFNFKMIDDAVGVYKKIKEIYENYKKKEGGDIKINIIGGGFTGVELSAELACCVKNIIEDENLDKKCTAINLIEAGPNILPAISEKARKKIEKRLNAEMVRIKINSPVSEVGPNFIKIGDTGEIIESDLTIWAGGIRGSRLLENLGLKMNKKGMIEINEFLQTENEKIFAIGDNAAFTDPKTGKPVPAMAHTAFEQGETAAKNIINHITNRKLRPYKPFYDSWIVPAGGKWAYFHYKRTEITGFLGYVLRQLVDFRHFSKTLPITKALSLFFKDLVIFTKND